MASLLVNALEQVGQLHKTDDDLCDRLNHRFTVILLVTFSAFVSAKQFVGEPISCWAPSQLSGAQVSYTNSICWLKGTYYLETDRRLIPHHTENNEFRIAYYQFIPYVLLFMALLFYLPHIFWRHGSRYFGFDIRRIIQDMKNVVKKDLHRVALQIHAILEFNASKYKINRQKNIYDFSGIFRYRLSSLYFFVKILYVINCFCQFYLLSIFLSFSFPRFGYDWLLMIMNKVQTRINNHPNESKWFPRVVMCDFMVRHLGSNQHWMSIQCNLPINLFNELIFLIIWGWLIFVTIFTCLSLLLTSISILTKFNHRSLRKYLQLKLPKLTDDEQKMFIRDYLQQDGILLVQLISHNTNDVIMSHLLAALYNLHCNSSKNDYHCDDQSQSNGHYKRIDSSSI